MIPLVGCQVKITKGIHAGKSGRIESVKRYKAKLQSMSEYDARLFFHAVRANYGENWTETWYEAVVRLEGLSTKPIECSSIKILDETKVRGCRK